MAKNFSPRAQKLVTVLAQEEGKKSGSDQLQPEHILLALLNCSDGLGYILLQKLRINILNFRLALEQSLLTSSRETGFSDLPISRRTRSLIDAAAIESRSLRRDYIGTEHLVLAAIREQSSVTSRFFERANISFDYVLSTLNSIYEKFRTSHDGQDKISTPILSTGDRSGRAKSGKQSFLASFSRDLTELARTQQLDPVVGREREVKRIIQILSRRTKNNPVLLGDPGVGKTAIVEGLAHYIAKGAVPRNLFKKRILSLDLTSVVAGTRYRGDFEERIDRILKEVLSDKDIILFIDELHTLIGAGSGEGTMDASNMLKPALARGELQCIGATTSVEYRKYFEKDAALERRFQPVNVEEPSDEDAVLILEGIKKKYEAFHGVTYDEGVIPAVVRLSRRYITDRYLPDKAIDLLDEAGAMKKIDEEEKPLELEELEANINDLIEEKSLLVQNQDYERAAEVRDKVLLLKGQLEALRERWEKHGDGKYKLVTVNDVCTVISSMTGIPVNQLSSSELARLLNMEQELHKTVIGQDEAIAAIASAVRRSRIGISSSKRPAGSFVFLGPTGVGKTHLAKALALFLFGGEDALIRIDMSDFVDKHGFTRLVGSAPGYIGYEEGGVLTNKVLRRPYSVVLFDEVEKAHPRIFNLLLQILEEGELVDGQGHVVNFRNTIIIMTSNAGIRQITESSTMGFALSDDTSPSYETIKEGAMAELKRIFSPELLNRIDDAIVFTSLTKKEVEGVLEILLKEFANRLLEKNLKLVVKPAVKKYLVENGFDPSNGARPMRRLIQREIEEQLSLRLIEAAAKNQEALEGTVAVSMSRGKVKVSLTRKNLCEKKETHTTGSPKNK